MRPQTVAGARRHRLRRAGARRPRRRRLVGARRRHRLRLAGAGPRRPRRRRLAGAPRRPKTEYFDPSARGVCEEPSTERPGDGVKLGPLLLQWRPVATKRSLMLACSVVVQSSLRSSRKAMLQLSLIDHPGHHRRVTSPPIDSL